METNKYLKPTNYLFSEAFNDKDFAVVVKLYLAEDEKQKGHFQDRLLRLAYSQAHQDSDRGEPSIEFLQAVALLKGDSLQKFLMNLYWEIYNENYKEM